MNWLKSVLMKIFRGAIEQLVQESLDKTVAELTEEINDSFEDEKERETLISGIVMLRNKVVDQIQERL